MLLGQERKTSRSSQRETTTITCKVANPVPEPVPFTSLCSVLSAFKTISAHCVAHLQTDIYTHTHWSTRTYIFTYEEFNLRTVTNAAWEIPQISQTDRLADTLPNRHNEIQNWFNFNWLFDFKKKKNNNNNNNPYIYTYIKKNKIETYVIESEPMQSNFSHQFF